MGAERENNDAENQQSDVGKQVTNDHRVRGRARCLDDPGGGTSRQRHIRRRMKISIFEADIEWLAGAGATAGCNPPMNDNFCPDDSVTRRQTAASMRRFAGFLGAEDGTTKITTGSASACSMRVTCSMGPLLVTRSLMLR